MRTSLLFGAALGLASLLPTAASASTIFWGSLGTNDTLVDSAGNVLDSSYRFEIGTFVSGFEPDKEHFSTWEANWNIFDAAIAGDGWLDPDVEVSRSVDHTASGNSTSSYASGPPGQPGAPVFTQGERVYLWVFNTKTLGPTTEWALAYDRTDPGAPANTWNPWVVPDPSLQSGESADFQFRDLDVPVWGGVNNVDGPGERSVAPPTFTLQTQVIPEPGSLLLGSLAGLMMIFRRRR
jgi:hypothetical protein